MLPLLLGPLRGRFYSQRRWHDARVGTVPCILANKNANLDCPHSTQVLGRLLPPRTFRRQDPEKVLWACASRRLALARLRLRSFARRQRIVFSQTKLLPQSLRPKKCNEGTAPDISRATPPGRVCRILNVNLAVSPIWTEVYSTGHRQSMKSR